MNARPIRETFQLILGRNGSSIRHDCTKTFERRNRVPNGERLFNGILLFALPLLTENANTNGNFVLLPKRNELRSREKERLTFLPQSFSTSFCPAAL